MKHLTIAIGITILALFLLAWVALDAHAAPVPDYRCINHAGCYYMPYSRVVSEADVWVIAPVGTVLGIGDWSMLWRLSDWEVVVP